MCHHRASALLLRCSHVCGVHIIKVVTWKVFKYQSTCLVHHLILQETMYQTVAYTAPRNTCSYWTSVAHSHKVLRTHPFFAYLHPLPDLFSLIYTTCQYTLFLFIYAVTYLSLYSPLFLFIYTLTYLPLHSPLFLLIYALTYLPLYSPLFLLLYTLTYLPLNSPLFLLMYTLTYLTPLPPACTSDVL